MIDLKGRLGSDISFDHFTIDKTNISSDLDFASVAERSFSVWNKTVLAGE